MARDQLIKFRVSPIEKKAIELTAEAIGMSVSDYCRKSALGKEVHMRFSEEQMQVYKNLYKYHANFTHISQLVKARDYNSELLPAIEEVIHLISAHLKSFKP